MDFLTAKTSVLNIINSLSIEDKSHFFSWGKDYFSNDSFYTKEYFELRIIAEDIKTLIPAEAILPTEKIVHSKIDPKSPILHVDSFLYEDDDIDELVEEKKLSRNYCTVCHSVDVAPITFISHSTSAQRIQYIFKQMLPDLSGKVVLDVGSRLGAVLYGAFYCSSARKIIGVEMNQDFCNLQNHIINKYRLNDRVQIICSDISHLPQVVQESDVIVLINVFECFMEKEEQERTWDWLRIHIIKPGALVVTVPSLEETFSKLQTDFDISTWLRKIDISQSDSNQMDDPDIIHETCLYTVV